MDKVTYEMTQAPKIIYTHTDEAPALATYSFLPFVKAFCESAGVTVETRDISLAGRILAHFADHIDPDKRVHDALAELGELAELPDANIIKLPNISASVPQLKAAIAELQSQGYDLPDYPEDPADDKQRDIKSRYDSVKGSAVNPVLRQGNSDRRAPKAVKAYARAHPHSMGAWSGDSRSTVATMSSGDFRNNEKSLTMKQADTVRIEHVDDAGQITVLKDSIELQADEVLDSTYMSRKALVEFLQQQVAQAKAEGVLFSLHMKATMMKVSDPIIFGHGVRTFFKSLFDSHGDVFKSLGVDVNNGFGDLVAKIQSLPDAGRQEIESAIESSFKTGPAIAMVDSDRGITNLHVPSDVIIDASMPAMIRTSGCMWNADGETQETLAVIPDSSYSGVYKAVFDDCKANGAFDPTTMGSVPNVGLMAQKAEEYGSHDKTFEISSDGVVRIVGSNGDVLMSHDVEQGDIWRACQVKDGPVRDWVKLAVSRARATGCPAVFWLDKDRAHDAQLIVKVENYLKDHDTSGLEFHILSPVEATRFSLDRIRRGEDTISVTGNVLRDYLTDLFPILEVGTSAKMLSIVPLMNGGGLFETGAGGSAPKLVQQFIDENHLRWDSLGEFLALAASLEHLADRFDNPRAKVLSEALDAASTNYLMENHSPSRRVGELDNRGTHVYLATAWARAIADQKEDSRLADRFRPVAEALEGSLDQILGQLVEAQGPAMDIGGYYQPDIAKASAAMRPSQRLNEIVEGLLAPA
tara:strand:- start:923 stop:3181 length:2259 start_codon:yes stop_codon:yes gene_type:complete